MKAKNLAGQSCSGLPVHTFKPFYLDGNCGLLWGIAAIVTLAGVLMVGLTFVSDQVEGTGLVTPVSILGVILGVFGLIGIVFIDGYNLRCPSCKQSWAMGWDERHNLIFHGTQRKISITCSCKHCGYQWIYEYGK